MAHALVEENPSKAAGIKASYSEKAASDCARRLEKLPVLIARIEFLGPKALEKREITVKRIAKACSQIALATCRNTCTLTTLVNPSPTARNARQKSSTCFTK